MPDHSERVLEIRLPEQTGGHIIHTTATDQTWEHDPGPLQDAWKTAAIWDEIAGADPRGRLVARGAEMAGWLFNERALAYLRQARQQMPQSAPRLRIDLRVSALWHAEYPWEIAYLDGLGGHLGTLHDFTFARLSQHGEIGTRTDRPLEVLLCGVRDDRLQTGTEIERVREAIETKVVSGGRPQVKLDARGVWQQIVDAFEQHGTPHVFHFAGHGLEDGRGLVFLDASGGRIEIDSVRVASLLTRDGHRPAQLAFLNACSTADPGGGPYQPFGGVAQVLVGHGVPMVIGLQTPVMDGEARRMAEVFYRAVADGDAVDCAVQAAREALYLREQRGVGWAFLSLHMSGSPKPLVGAGQEAQSSADSPSSVIWQFGHRQQRVELADFLHLQSPLVCIAYGPLGSGHRHVFDRTHHDLIREQRHIWTPVPQTRLSFEAEEELQRGLLAADILSALGESTEGDQDELEQRLADRIVECVRDDKLLVIDVVDVATPVTPSFAEGVRTLVQDLWPEVVSRAKLATDHVSAFLLVPLAYPVPARDEHESLELMGARTLVCELMKTLSDSEMTEPRIEVLPELGEFTEDEVARFLDRSMNLGKERARRLATEITRGAPDNETILDRLRAQLDRLGVE